MSDCGCEGDAGRAGTDPAYRRALWIVVILNMGFGLFELVGGFVAGSQALKADSLDFIGDGSITLVGLIALGWAAVARSRVALVQGLFLASLGLGVIGFAIWRAFNAIPPEAELMGGIGVVAMWLQKRRGWNMGRTQLVCDAIILLAAIPVMSGVKQWLLSVVSAAAIAGVLMVNHKPGRYAGY